MHREFCYFAREAIFALIFGRRLLEAVYQRLPLRFTVRLGDELLLADLLQLL